MHNEVMPLHENYPIKQTIHAQRTHNNRECRKKSGDDLSLWLNEIRSLFLGHCNYNYLRSIISMETAEFF